MIAEPGGGGGFFQGITEAVNELKAAASNGGFTVNDEAGKDLQAAITQLQGVINDALAQSTYLSTEPALGTSPAANVFKKFIPTVATDQTQGAIPAFKQFQKDLQDAHDTIGRSMTSYQQTEQDNKGGINNAGNGGIPT